MIKVKNSDFTRWIQMTFLRADQHLILPGYHVVILPFSNSHRLSADQVIELAHHLLELAADTGKEGSYT